MPHPNDTPQPQPGTNETRAKDDLVEQALFNLIPFFMEGAAGDPVRARRAAFELLKAYPIRSMLELQLVTEFIAFSQSALHDLRAAKADPDMPEPQRQKLRIEAIALNRAGHRTMRILEKVFETRDQTAAVPAESVPARQAAAGPDSEQAAMLDAMRERIARQREQLAARQGVSAPEPGAPGPFMNRDQRRTADLAAKREARRAAG